MNIATERLEALSATLESRNAVVAMPGLVRKLLIFAAVDGLILQPSPPRNHKPTTEQAIKVGYKENGISPLLKDRREEEHKPEGLEVFGIIGLLKISTTSFLIAISRREEVAEIRDKPIYMITDVTLIPLSSQADAENAITQARNTIRKHSGANADDEELSDSETIADTDTRSIAGEESLPPSPPPEPSNLSAPSHQRRSSVAEDVIERRGKFGRFAQSWFSKKGWTTDGRKGLGVGSQEDLGKQSPEAPLVNDDKKLDAESSGLVKQESADVKDAEVKAEEIPAAMSGEKDSSTTTALLPKILRTTKLYFGSKNFFYSYDYDISRPLHGQEEAQSIPLYRSFDPLFFWNSHIIQPLIQSGQQSFILPVMQGFVGQREFTIKVNPSNEENVISDAASKPEEVVGNQKELAEAASETTNNNEKKFLLTLISRRSIKRAGLRYLRRGVDEDGNVANSVESEQILSSQSWDPSEKVYSFTQYRGSMPLYFSQTPYSFKPAPTFYGSDATNAAAFKKHFEQLSARYGGIQVDSLVEKKGQESTVGELYERHAKQLNEQGGIDGKGKQLGFEWFDFHAVCRGMKFENVSVLIDTIEPAMTSYGWTVAQNNQLLSTQKGILRTNCMDCLDRTNVVQSAAARDALEKQLAQEKCTIDLVKDLSTSWFNTLWADNGDAISRQYAGTAALKGDFTRTRQRKITGALTDFSLTLSRYYNNIVNDYFAQACIDYLLGRATSQIFEEFQSDMTNKDYAVDLRRVRENAIENCAKIVIEDTNEDMVNGWTLSAPAKSDTLRSPPFEESVLILTTQALYFVRFDWGTEKPRSFEKVPLERITGLTRGTYIISTLGERHMNEQKNVGVKIGYKVEGPDEGVIRQNTRSLANEQHADEVTSEGAPTDEQNQDKAEKSSKWQEDNVYKPSTATSAVESSSHFWAFRALPPSSAIAYGAEGQAPQQTQTEMEMMTGIAGEIAKAVNDAKKGTKGEDEVVAVEQKDIISLADAKKSTGYLESLTYGLKKLVWA